ncbi:MAG: hypothetical protein ACFFFG_17250 [Candidatus Thorarchaeota archaeon]
MNKIRFILNETGFIFRTIRFQMLLFIIPFVFLQWAYLSRLNELLTSLDLPPGSPPLTPDVPQSLIGEMVKLMLISSTSTYATIAAFTSIIFISTEKIDKVTEQIFMAPMSKLEVVFYRFVAMTPIILTVVFVFVFVNYISTILFVGFLDPFFIIMILGLALVLALSLSYIIYLIALILSEKYVVLIFVATIISAYWIPLLFMVIIDDPTILVTTGPIVATSLVMGTIGLITTLALKGRLIERIVVTSL